MSQDEIIEYIKQNNIAINELNEGLKKILDKQLVLFKTLDCFLKDYSESVSAFQQLNQSEIYNRIILCSQKHEVRDSFLRIVE